MAHKYARLTAKCVLLLVNIVFIEITKIDDTKSSHLTLTEVLSLVTTDYIPAIAIML